VSTSTSRRLPEPNASRVIARLAAPSPGPTLICVTALHGNEPAGLTAIRRVTQRLADSKLLRRGTLWGLIGNQQALAVGRRFIDRDLNRGWGRSTPGSSAASAHSAEDSEQVEVWDAIEFAKHQSTGPVFLIDLHTTSGRGKPFTVFADALACRQFALVLPCPIILGLEEHLEGTLIEYATRRGLVSIAIEGGQHTDPGSVNALEASVWLALRSCRLIDRLSEVASGYTLLEREAAGLPRAVEVRARHAVTPGDGFRMHQGFATFDRVRIGQLLAADRAREIQAPRDGYLLMPLYQEQGDDGFFIVTSVRRIWLVLSRLLRAARADRIAAWLPGVRRDPDHPDDLVVDRAVARWVALELLHLLGYRKLCEANNILRVTKQHD
jgi:predicted deacylase